METVKKIVNSIWFNSAAAGAVAIGFGIYGKWFAAGIALGFGIKTFLGIFKSAPKAECACGPDCDCKKEEA